MGTNVILDILTSIVIGGMLLTNILNLQGNSTSQSTIYNTTRIAQRNLVTTATMIEYDFNKIGYGVDATVEPILVADSDKIVYMVDINRDEKVDTISYYIGPTSQLTRTPNPRDRLLFRSVNGERPDSTNLGVTEFKLKYYNQDLNPPSSRAEIAIIEITLKVECTYPIENTRTGKLEYPNAYWKQTRVKAKNLVEE